MLLTVHRIEKRRKKMREVKISFIVPKHNIMMYHCGRGKGKKKEETRYKLTRLSVTLERQFIISSQVESSQAESSRVRRSGRCDDVERDKTRQGKT
jgi:hypothetical protein